MPQDHSFDIVSQPNAQEVDNALLMAAKELANRFDFKGSISSIAKEGDKIKLVSEDEFKLKNVWNILTEKFAKRQVPLKFFEPGKVETSLGGSVKQEITIKKGIPQERAKEMTKLIKASGLKVQAQIQGDEIRVSGKKLDDLQAVIARIKAANLPIALSFTNYR
ncbi:MAG: YajQ family cyclic di-GMP-binding protein [Candidatus Saganbacteria bacterium]|nr:YajQ family cyclic di-GMP-binding protein [Candidatus Saganbacteria bacterium]